MIRKFSEKNSLFFAQEDKIVKLQALWRGRIARRAFHSLLRSEKPPFPVVRHFSSILNFNAEDYDKDLQLQVGFVWMTESAFDSDLTVTLTLTLTLTQTLT